MFDRLAFNFTMFDFTSRKLLSLFITSILTIATLLVPAEATPVGATTLDYRQLQQDGHDRTEPVKTAIAGYRVLPAGGDVAINWSLTNAMGAADQVSAANLDFVAIDALLEKMVPLRWGQYTLPVQIETLLVSNDAPLVPQIHHLSSVPWPKDLADAVEIVPLAIDWDSESSPLTYEARALPKAPVVVLSEGRIRGQRIALVAFSPIFEDESGLRIASEFQSELLNVSQGPEDLGDLIGGGQTLLAGGVRSASDGARTNIIASAPQAQTNRAAATASVKIHVHNAGIQSLTGAHLMQAGLAQNVNLFLLQLTYQGKEVGLEVRDSDGFLGASTEIRFYAPHPEHSMKPGDRWNNSAVYWLTIGTVNGKRMQRRNAFPNAAPLRTVGVEKGIWERNTIYESNMGGIDGDHWFAERLVADPVVNGETVPSPRLALVLSHQLPLATASLGLGIPSVFTVTGSSRTIASHRLSIRAGNTEQVESWTNDDYYEDWTFQIQSTAPGDQVELILHPVASPSGLRVDKVYWHQPVDLNLGERGATFSGIEGTWRYQLANLPQHANLYDVSDPLAPQILHSSDPAFFEDGPTPRDYIVSGPGTLHIPTAQSHTPVLFGASAGADAIYIGPGEFLDELLPLIEHRRRQGYQVVFFDIQKVYDAWSFGEVSPNAIRELLRFVVNHWTPSPISAVLVGDTTTDPLNFSGARSGNANTNVVPTYLAEVDPLLGETACENCMAQLDDDDPLAGPTDTAFLVDIWLGRLSVQNEEQLSTVVNKILRYEGANDRGFDDTWRQTSLFLADNFVESNGAKDSAGNFAYLSDLVIQGDSEYGFLPSQKRTVNTRRVYYDPSPGGVTDPWREPDPARARLRAIEEFKQGPGIVTFNGHSNHFQWATTDRSLEHPYLFGTNDIFELKNIDQLSIVLEMTCYTSQFTYISTSGTTLDERLLRHTDGGAVAVWGSAGLGVAHGHDELMKGFQKALWSRPAMSAKMGELVTSGYNRLFTHGTCCKDSQKVYVLLGDPLMPALVWAPDRNYIPIVQK